MKTIGDRQRLRRAIALASLIPLAAGAAESETQMEEVVVQARLKDSAEQLINERIDDEVVTDLIGAEMISRIGDADVAAALRRVTGVSLVNDKFVYVRGLGERYSSTTLNGAIIPSPDLTRNVIPLDVFPTAIVESLAVQKSYSPDRNASFGGGNIDIRTKGIPDSFTWQLEMSSGFSAAVDGDVLTYAGGSDDRWGTDDGTRALSPEVLGSLNRFLGQIGPQGILNGLRREGDADATLAEAQATNRQIALELNRNLTVLQDDAEPDYGVKGSIGNNFYLTDDLEAGFLLGGGYSSKWRETETLARNVGFPEERFERETETTRSIDIVGNLNFGARYTDDHRLSTTSLFIRNTDDEVAIIDFFNENREKSSGIGFRNTDIKFEEREVLVHQAKGEHFLGYATKQRFAFLPLDWVPDEAKIDWQYTEAEALTSIPNEVSVAQQTVTDPVTAEVKSSAVALQSSAADYRFTELDDDVLNYSWQFTWPITMGASVIELSGGTEYARKVRTYRQTQFGLGPLEVSDFAVLEGPLGGVFSDSNISDPDNNFVVGLTGTNNQSYIAATLTDGAFGKVDWIWNDTWRLMAGARWESYRQTALDWNIFSYSISSPQISNDPAVLENAVFTDDDYHPALALTYMGSLWAETFQLRFGWSETVVRPDLREITDASYVDARTGFITDGNPGVIPASMTNFDVRAEWFFASGDNFTVTAFLKDIENPIEFFESPASDTNRSREIINAESGEVYGVEIEGLKDLSFLGRWGEAFFLQGNATVQESELIAGVRADSPTSDVRQLAGASDYVLNLLLGFDAFNGRHSATLVYNVFGERLFTAGRLGIPDSFEQPFHALDMTYSWYPTDTMTLKLRLQNLLDEEITIEQAGVETFVEQPGTSFSISFQWQY